MDIRAAEITAILKDQIKNFGQEAEVTEVGQVLSASMASNLSRSAFTASMDFSSRANSNKAVA